MRETLLVRWALWSIKSGVKSPLHASFRLGALVSLSPPLTRLQDRLDLPHAKIEFESFPTFAFPNSHQLLQLHRPCPAGQAVRSSGKGTGSVHRDISSAGVKGRSTGSALLFNPLKLYDAAGGTGIAGVE